MTDIPPDRVDPEPTPDGKPDWAEPDVWKATQQDQPHQRQRRNRSRQDSLHDSEDSEERVTPDDLTLDDPLQTIYSPATDDTYLSYHRVARLVEQAYEAADETDRPLLRDVVSIIEPDPPVAIEDREIAAYAFACLPGWGPDCVNRLPDIREDLGYDRYPSDRTDVVTDAHEAM